MRILAVVGAMLLLLPGGPAEAQVQGTTLESRHTLEDEVQNEREAPVFVGRHPGLPVQEAQFYTGENLVSALGSTVDECHAALLSRPSPVKMLELTNDNGAVNIPEIAAMRVQTREAYPPDLLAGEWVQRPESHRLAIIYRGSIGEWYYDYPTLKAAKRDYRRLLEAAGEKP